MNRRSFMLGCATALSFAGGAWAQPARRRTPLIFDAMGELRTTYDRALITEMKQSGLDAITLTLCDPKTVGPRAFEEAVAAIREHDRFVAANSDLLLFATSASDIDRARESGRIAVFYYFQNTEPFGADLDNVALFHRLGIRSCQLTYNFQNRAGSGSREPAGNGISVFGRQLVERMNRERMLIDLSHANMKTMADAIAASSAPVIVSHTGCTGVYENYRNTTDENLRALADKGGVVGIYQIRPFLTARPSNAALPDYFAHIDHAVRTCGADHVAIGSDRDHRVIVMTEAYLAEVRREEGSNFHEADWPLFIDELNGPRRMEVVWDGLRRLGYASGDIEKILGGNLRRLYETVIG
ncbi:membrane dipeptidase [Sphingosinicella sp. LHD-64]|uniref:dipeptidase n=1 Tax=Sphingosinicella sp. LHD-64 TaxID=3072139 RepID=UPI00280E774E|nr:membrane dipeptidase [Sphingosinicella sp. LHD-64]MDQ8757707.1 membrane dipeptidase [Sphingosinicella sp. LHD-64]